MRNELRSLKDDILSQGRPESKVNTPLLSEGLIEGRAAGRDTGQALAREHSVMSGFRERLGHSGSELHICCSSAIKTQLKLTYLSL